MSPSQPRIPLPDLFTDEQWAALAKRFRLSKRQRETARLICLGYSNKAIGSELGIRHDTIRMHNRELFKKLSIRQRIGVPIRLFVAERELTRPESASPVTNRCTCASCNGTNTLTAWDDDA